MSWTNPYAVSTSDVNLVEAKEFLDHYSPSSLPFASETDFHSTREAIQKADTLCDEVKALLPEGKYCLADDPVHVLRAANNEVLMYRSTVGNAKSSDVGDQKSRDVIKDKVNELHGVIHTARLAHAEFIDCNFKRTSEVMAYEDEGEDQSFVLVKPPVLDDDLEFTAMTDNDKPWSQRRKAFYTIKAAHLASRTMTTWSVAHDLGPEGRYEEDQLVTVRDVVKNRDTIKATLSALDPKMGNEGLQSLETLVQALANFESTLQPAFDERKRKLTWVAVVDAAEEYVLTFANLMNVPIKSKAGSAQAPMDSNADTEMSLDSASPAAEASESDAKVMDLSRVCLPLSAMAQTTSPSTTASSNSSH